MADVTFNTKDGQTIARELLVAYIDTGTNEWSPIGKRVEDSSAEYDWSEETSQDILGNTFTTMKKPTVTQSFDPLPLDAGDAASKYIWGLAVRDQDAQALASQKMLIAHFYADSAQNFAEKYDSCAVRVTGLGGEGGGNIDMPIEVTYGGTRTLGTVTRAEGSVTFSPSEE